MCVLAKQGTDLHSSALSQMIADDLLRHGALENNIPKIQALYRERRDTMLEALDARLTGHAQWTRPDGGLFLWMTVPGENDSPGLLAETLKKNVAFVPGDAFYFDGRGLDSLRLNFSVTPPETIREGINRLSDVILERQIHVAGVR
jgi:2-aminoadipate transaminase